MHIPTRPICENSIMREMADRAAAVTTPPAAEIPGQVQPIEMQCTISITLVTSYGLPAAMPSKQHVANWLVADGQVFEHIGGGLRFDACAQHEDPEECTEDTPCGTFITYQATIVTVDEVQ